MEVIRNLLNEFNTITLFGLAILLGLAGGEAARRIRFLPKISGYILVGFILGPDVFNIMTQSVLVTARLFVDISLGLILFDLGRHLDFTWLKHDRGLLPTAIAESAITFICIFALAYYFIHLPWQSSALAATFAIATSPAVVMMVAYDLSSEGPVTRRTLILTSLNNLFALSLFTLLLPMTKASPIHSLAPWKQAAQLYFESAGVALVIFMVTKIFARYIGKQKESQFILSVCALVLTIGIAQMLSIPTALTLFLLGVATRNLDRNHTLMDINFGSIAQLFFILLFVVTGTYLRLDGLRTATLAVALFILIRLFAKTAGIWLFSSRSKLTWQQVFTISLALTPMAGLAMSMSNVLEDFNPDINRQISAIIAAVVAILELLGPIATQFAFIFSKEAASKNVDEA